MFYSVFFFLVLLCAGGLTVFIIALAKGAGVALFHPGDPWLRAAFILGMVVSLLMGLVAALGASHITMRPIRRLTEGMDRLAHGDFGVRLDLGGYEEARRISESFNRMAEELGSIETLRSGFVNDFSHEFKTPIVSLRGYARLLRDPDLPPEERAEYVGIIIRESDRLTALATSVLTLSRLENRAIAPTAEPFDLAEQLRRSAVEIMPRVERAGLMLDAELEECTLCGSPELLELIWSNLLDNAVKFSPAGGTVTLSLHCGGGRAEVTVRDEGCGIPPEQQERIFHRFYQGDRAHATQGAGIGLAIVRRAAELCGGSVRVVSSPGAGAEFTVTLPLNAEENA